MWERVRSVRIYVGTGWRKLWCTSGMGMPEKSIFVLKQRIRSKDQVNKSHLFESPCWLYGVIMGPKISLEISDLAVMEINIRIEGEEEIEGREGGFNDDEDV
ncbi:hypothetical protein Sjap_012721 [Stephania japonica]|uniref:Uncharacterized protein n=1 Tax=Stephania japonica TaxID=461633 RepID=A0AAP0IWN0_9MAGN